MNNSKEIFTLIPEIHTAENSTSENILRVFGHRGLWIKPTVGKIITVHPS